MKDLNSSLKVVGVDLIKDFGTHLYRYDMATHRMRQLESGGTIPKGTAYQRIVVDLKVVCDVEGKDVKDTARLICFDALPNFDTDEYGNPDEQYVLCNSLQFVVSTLSNLQDIDIALLLELSEQFQLQNDLTIELLGIPLVD